MSYWPLVAGLLAAAVVGAIDSSAPLGIAVGVLYVLAIPIAVLSARRGHVFVLAAVCSALVLVMILKPSASGVPLHFVLINRGLSVLAIWTTAALLWWHLRRTDDLLAAREQAHALFRDVLEAAPDGMIMVGADGRIQLANATAERMFRYAPGTLAGTPVEHLMPESHREAHVAHRRSFHSVPAARAMGSGRTFHAVRGDGSAVSVEIALSPARADPSSVIAAIRDVTERHRLEERLRTTQRMEGIGRLAGGVAHDFNNLLTVILSCVEFSLPEVADRSRVAADLTEAKGAAERATSLTRQLLAFSRRQIVEPRVLSINELLLDMDRMLRRILGEDIELVTVPDPRLWPVEIDPSCVEQVLMNLTVNARDAMSHGGKLTLETENVSLDQEYAREHPDVTPGDYVRLAVSDTGVGMTNEVSARIFEPFFTTKPAGMGTGLGLATVYGIVRQAGGHIWVYSEPGRGTSFKVYLPRAQGSAQPLPERPASMRPRVGTETILVVEDEPSVRRLIVRALRQHGYLVHEAGNGVEAMLKLQSAELGLHLLVTDVVMPQMGGRELARRVLELHPDVAVLYLSGYTENAIVHHGTLEAGLALLQKPFLPDALLRRVRDVLDARDNSR
ncbi:MAG: PAS domain S-box protein [Sandaracinaceae bacterium]|nr:PAS domain S-box protein [Sandaracinaceae bacterium]